MIVTHRTDADLPVMMDVQDMAALLGVGRSKAYELCRQPGFPVVRIGKQLRIPRELLLRWIEEQTLLPEPNRETQLSLN